MMSNHKNGKRQFPSMPTTESSMIVLSLQSALIVAGGITLPSYAYQCTDAVEIFKPNTSQWYRTNPLPMACDDICQVAIGNTCYALGGYGSEHLNRALYASVVVWGTRPSLVKGLVPQTSLG